MHMRGSHYTKLYTREIRMRDLEKLNVASELLHQALRLYYEGGAFFSSLHLAGAAEEVLGKYVELSGGVSAFKSLQTGAVKLSAILSPDKSPSNPKGIANIINHAKNNTKHGHGEVNFDPKMQAHDLLDRAVTNYYFLMSHYELEETELVRRFNHELTNV
jgi:hypothetical protein